MKAMRKSILACVLCLALCLGLFAGATFAWFTDTVSSTGNTITAGTLDVEAYAYDLAGDADQGMSVTIDGVNGGEAITFSSARQDLNKNDPPPIINESNWEPGQSSAKLLQVQNAGTLNAKVGIEFSVSGELTDALWFDFIQVDPSSVTDGVAGGTGSVIGTFTQREMNTLATFAQNLELTLEAANDGAADSIFFVFVYGMKTTAGNEYQNTSFTADVTVFATQATGEEDGFGNPDYDIMATYKVGTADELMTALDRGGVAQLNADIALTEPVTVTNADAAISLNGKTLSASAVANPDGNAFAALAATEGKSLTISNGTIDMSGYNAFAPAAPSAISATSGGKIVLSNVEYTSDNTGVYVQGQGSTVEIVHSTVSAPTYCVGTNASSEDNHGVNIRIIDSELRSPESDGWTNIGVMINVPGNLYIEGSTISGEVAAVMVRGGTATIKDSTLLREVAPTGYSDTYRYYDKDWVSGNGVPLATLLIGNRGTSYQYPASCTLENCIVACTFAMADADAPAGMIAQDCMTVYLYGNTGEGLGASLTYDADTVFQIAETSIAFIVQGDNGDNTKVTPIA